MKFPLSESNFCNPHLRDRFERETKILAKLEHAAIVPLYDVGHDNKQLFFVMR